MRVLVVGGYGVFGRFLAELLVRDGHDVTVAGRNLARAQTCANALGAAAMQVDMRGDLNAVFAGAPDVVVDAAGPFHTYGDDPLRLPSACIANGVHYFDLSDNAAFTALISALDARAKVAGVVVLSGASSTPALNAAAVAELARGGDIHAIDTAILPGNDAPRGLSVIASIVSGVGHPIPVTRGGQPGQVSGWTDRRTYVLPNGQKRAGYAVHTPDLNLFPNHFDAQTVTFRAGLELGVMNGALRVLAALRRVVPLPMGPVALRLLRALSGALRPFGSDSGAMIVRVLGTWQGRVQARRWTLWAENGDGPYVPGIAIRTALRHLDQIAPGAGPALTAFTLEQAQAAMSDLSISFHQDSGPVTPLFQRALGPDWDQLPPLLQQTHIVHDTKIISGQASVRRGAGPLNWLIGRVLGFPDAADSVPVTVTMTQTAQGERWTRNFGGQCFTSHLSAATRPGHFRERFGVMMFELSLPVTDGTLGMPVARGWLLGIPLPRFCLPRSVAREYVENHRFHFDVVLYAPLGLGLIAHYRGDLG